MMNLFLFGLIVCVLGLIMLDASMQREVDEPIALWEPLADFIAVIGGLIMLYSVFRSLVDYLL